MTSEFDPATLSRHQLVDLVVAHERRLLAGLATHAEMRDLTDAEFELLRRDARKVQRSVASDRASRASLHATGENLLRT